VTFAAQIAAFEKKTNAELERIAHGAMTIMHLGLVETSPLGEENSGSYEDYKPGTFQNNWTVTMGSPATGLDFEEADKGAAHANALYDISALKTTEMWYVTNNTPYGPAIEFEQWSGKRFPHTRKGVIRPLVLAGGWQNIVNEAQRTASESDEVPF